MKDWLVPLAPLGVVSYLVLLPAQFSALLHWLQTSMLR